MKGILFLLHNLLLKVQKSVPIEVCGHHDEHHHHDHHDKYQHDRNQPEVHHFYHNRGQGQNHGGLQQQHQYHHRDHHNQWNGYDQDYADYDY